MIDFVETKGDFAISIGVSAGSNASQSSPSVVISVYHILPYGSILEAAEFNYASDGPDFFHQGGKPWQKCPSNPMFDSNISTSSKSGLPTADEIAISNLAFDNMPTVDGIKWNP